MGFGADRQSSIVKGSETWQMIAMMREQNENGLDAGGGGGGECESRFVTVGGGVAVDVRAGWLAGCLTDPTINQPI